MKKIIILFILISNYTFSQTTNDYEYVFVPAKFSIFKEKDKYRTSTNTKLLLQKYGFKSFFITDSIPLEIANTNCKKLYADLVNDNNFFITKVKIVLKDCQDKIVYETDFGTSREKDYATAYNQALREAGKSFDKLNYKYQPSQKSMGMIGEPVLTKVIHNEGKPMVLYPKKGIEGIDLVTKNPEVIYMTIKSTSVKDVFIAKRKEIVGIFFKDNEKWFFEYYLNTQKITEPLIVLF